MKSRLFASLSLLFIFMLTLTGILSTYFFYIEKDISQTEAAITSAELKTAQTKLKRWGYYNGNVDGIYGTKTRESVRKFQEIFDLPVTGVVNFATWYEISRIYVAVSKIGAYQ